MLKLILALLSMLPLTACLSFIQLGKSIPINGPGTCEENIELARHVLRSLPQDEVRRLVKVEFPGLTTKQLQNIYVSFTVRNIRKKDGASQHVVSIDITVNNPPIKNPEQVVKFLTSLVQGHLEKELPNFPKEMK